MKLNAYFRTLKGAVHENKLHRILLFALVFSNAVLAIAVFSKDETVVVVPPTLSTESKLSANKANAGLKEAWASFIVMQISNVTPRTADYVGTQVGKFIAPAAYATFMSDLANQARRIKEDNITVQFSPIQVFYVEERDIVVVSGEYVIRGVRDAESKSLRTYEIGLNVQNYQVSIDSITAYEGPWAPMREEAERERLRKERLAERASANG